VSGSTGAQFDDRAQQARKAENIIDAITSATTAYDHDNTKRETHLEIT
jgi:hypothetical protein